MRLEGNYRGFDVAMHAPGIAVVTMNDPADGVRAFREERAATFNRRLEAGRE